MDVGIERSELKSREAPNEEREAGKATRKNDLERRCCLLKEKVESDNGRKIVSSRQ